MTKSSVTDFSAGKPFMTKECHEGAVALFFETVMLLRLRHRAFQFEVGNCEVGHQNENGQCYDRSKVGQEFHTIPFDKKRFMQRWKFYWNTLTGSVVQLGRFCAAL